MFCEALLGTLKRQSIVAKYICCLQTNTRLERETNTNNHEETCEPRVTEINTGCLVSPIYEVIFVPPLVGQCCWPREYSGHSVATALTQYQSIIIKYMFFT